MTGMTEIAMKRCGLLAFVALVMALAGIEAEAAAAMLKREHGSVKRAVAATGGGSAA